MNELPGSGIEAITSEIVLLKQQLAQQLITYGKAQLGSGSTLRQIANYVGPQFQLSTDEAMELLVRVVGGDRA